MRSQQSAVAVSRSDPALMMMQSTNTTISVSNKVRVDPRLLAAYSNNRRPVHVIMLYNGIVYILYGKITIFTW